jgi:hypothetical protein
MGKLPVPPQEEGRTVTAEILDFQKFREELADRWTRAQAEAIKNVAPNALVSLGLIQWSVPSLLPAGPRHYSGFRPERQARYLDFLEVHFYPLARGAYDYQREADEFANLAYLESVVREVARPGKPVVLGEFGWYGGGKPKFDGGKHPAATQEQHAKYCRRVVETSKGFVTGWLNWGFYDQPEAQDCSEFTGLVTSDGKHKAWGNAFLELSRELNGKYVAPGKVGQRPVLDWDNCITGSGAGTAFLREYLQAFLKERKGE